VVERDAGQVSLCSLGEDGDARDDVGARLEVTQLLSVAAASLIARADASDATVRGEQLHGGRLREDHRAALLGLLREPASEPRQRRDDIAVVLHGRRRRNAQGASRRQEVDRLVLDRTVERHLVDALASLEEAAQRTWVDDRTGEQVRARLLALLQHGHGHFAETLAQLGRILEQLAEANRARQSGGAGADDQDADLDPLVRRIRRRCDVVARVERRRVVGGFHWPLRALTSSVSFGTISCTSPTTPRSEYSKIGAFGSLLIATITPELCMPTLCWIAPEMPHAM
jgi:hypothetical protein